MKATWISHTFCLWPPSHFLFFSLLSLLPCYFLCDPRRSNLITHFASCFGSLLSDSYPLMNKADLESWPVVTNFLVLWLHSPPFLLAWMRSAWPADLVPIRTLLMVLWFTSKMLTGKPLTLCPMCKTRIMPYTWDKVSNLLPLSTTSLMDSLEVSRIFWPL